MIVTRTICSRCSKLVPQSCDGRTFRVKGYPGMIVCRGRDGDDLDGRAGRYLVTRGHGDRQWHDIEEEQ